MTELYFKNKNKNKSLTIDLAQYRFLDCSLVIKSEWIIGLWPENKEEEKEDLDVLFVRNFNKYGTSEK